MSIIIDVVIHKWVFNGVLCVDVCFVVDVVAHIECHSITIIIIAYHIHIHIIDNSKL